MKRQLVILALLLISLPYGLRAEDGVQGITAISSKVSPGYARKKLPDGSFQPEYYAFGQGGKWGGEISDLTIDKLSFLDVAHVIAEPLAGRKFLPAKDPKTTSLVIMVYWGTTAVPPPMSESIALDHMQVAAADLAHYLVKSDVDPRKPIVAPGRNADAAMDQMTSATALMNMENVQRNRTDFRNALMLGYDDAGLIGTEQGNYFRGTALSSDRDDLYNEIEENRYFVVLMAYDFQILWKQKKHKLLWETRFSVSERNNQFDKALPFMAQHAALYFGEASHGLIRERVPEGHVDIGAPSLIEFLSRPKN
jgi:hypothetical protein